MKRILLLCATLAYCLPIHLMPAQKLATTKNARELSRLITKGNRPDKVAKLLQRRTFNKEQLNKSYDLAQKSEQQRALEYHATLPHTPTDPTAGDYVTGVASGTAIAAGAGSLSVAGFCGAMAAMGGLSIVFAPVAIVFGAVGIAAVTAGGFGINSLLNKPSPQELAAQTYKQAKEITQIIGQALNTVSK